MFLGYLTNLKSFTNDERGRMFLSIQTYNGLRMMVKSTIAITKFLMSEGFEFVLAERFCQDDVEEYFGYTVNYNKMYIREPLIFTRNLTLFFLNACSVLHN